MSKFITNAASSRPVAATGRSIFYYQNCQVHGSTCTMHREDSGLSGVFENHRAGGGTKARPRPRSLSSSRLPISKHHNDRVTIHVGGKRFVTLRSTLKKSPGSLLGNLEYFTEFYDDVRNEYFFDRSSEMFECILNFCRTGELHIPNNLCPELIKAELEFWKIDAKELCFTCCARYFESQRERHHMYKMAEYSMYLQQQKQKGKSWFELPYINNWVTKHPVVEKGVHQLSAGTVPIVQLLMTAIKNNKRLVRLFLILMLVLGLTGGLVYRLFEESSIISSVWRVAVIVQTAGAGDRSPQSLIGWVLRFVLGGIGLVVGSVVVYNISHSFNRLHHALELSNRMQHIYTKSDNDTGRVSRARKKSR